MIKVLLVDDHAVVRTGFRLLLNSVAEISEVAEAESEKIEGKEVTPFLLARLARATAGRSLAANIELVKNNAEVAARIARAYWEIL